MNWYKKGKHFAWFVFKSPQRAIVGFSTLFTDIKAWIFGLLAGKPSTQTLWVCIANYNRNEHILKIVIPSLLQANQKDKIGLSILDTGSTNFEHFKTQIMELWNGPLVINQINKPFARAWALNACVKQALGSWVLVTDADIALPANIVALAQKHTHKYQVWFPICQWQLEEKSLNWRWFTEGTGVFCAYKWQFDHAGKYNQAIETWGKEDWELFFNFYKVKIKPYRTFCENLYHHWHPSLQPNNYVKWF